MDPNKLKARIPAVRALTNMNSLGGNHCCMKSVLAGSLAAIVIPKRSRDTNRMTKNEVDACTNNKTIDIKRIIVVRSFGGNLPIQILSGIKRIVLAQTGPEANKPCMS